jgi:hypothetical protein
MIKCRIVIREKIKKKEKTFHNKMVNWRKKSNAIINVFMSFYLTLVYILFDRSPFFKGTSFEFIFRELIFFVFICINVFKKLSLSSYQCLFLIDKPWAIKPSWGVDIVTGKMTVIFLLYRQLKIQNTLQVPPNSIKNIGTVFICLFANKH